MPSMNSSWGLESGSIWRSAPKVWLRYGISAAAFRSGKLVECVSVINTGGKFNTDAFQFSVGLNGVGTKAVNALSSYFKVTSFRDGKFAAANFVQGELDSEDSGSSDEKNGTLVRIHARSRRL